MSVRYQGIIGFVIAVVLFGLVHICSWGHAPVFSADRSASASVYDESTMYAPGVTRFAEHLRPAWELDVIELRGERFSYPIMQHIVLGSLARVAGGVELAHVLAHSILPACSWLILFAWVWRARRDVALAGAAAWTSVVFAAAPRNVLLLGADAFTQPLEFSRTPHPSLSTLILLLALWGVLQCVTRQRTVWLWITGPLFGALFYSYYFHTVAAWTALGGVLLIMLFARPARWWRLLIIPITGMVVALPYFKWTLTGMRSGNSVALMRRIGEFEHTPSLPALAGFVMFAALFVWLGMRKPWEDVRRSQIWLLTAVITGAFVLANLHVLTGYNAQHEHAFNRIIQPLAVILLACALPLPAWPWRKWLLHAVSLCIISLGAVRQVHVAAHHCSFTQQPALFAALKKEGAEIVVGTLDESIRGLLPTLTPHWSFVPIGFRTLATNEEVLARFVVVAKMGGVSHDEARELLVSPDPQGYMRTYAYGLLDDFEIKPEDLQQFEKLWTATAPLQALKSRRLDLLLLPKGKAPAAFDGIQFDPAFEADGWQAWRVMLTSQPAR